VLTVKASADIGSVGHLRPQPRIVGRRARVKRRDWRRLFRTIQHRRRAAWRRARILAKPAISGSRRGPER
jgi:hypothetical protein